MPCRLPQMAPIHSVWPLDGRASRSLPDRRSEADGGSAYGKAVGQLLGKLAQIASAIEGATLRSPATARNVGIRPAKVKNRV
jgi:hypothetical protein